MQQWYGLCDSSMEDTLIEVPTVCRFGGINLFNDQIR